MKINIKKTKSLRLGINDYTELILGTGMIFSKDGGCSRMTNLEYPCPRVFFTVEQGLEELEFKSAALITTCSETWVLRKAEEQLINVLQKNFLRIVLGTDLTDST